MGKQQQQQKKVEERGGKGTVAPVSLRRSRPSGERGGRARAGGAGPGRGSGRSSLRGWDVRDAALAAEPPVGLGREGDAGGAGCAAGGCYSATCVALGLAQTPVQALEGSVLGSPRICLNLFKESFEWSECEGLCARYGLQHTVGIAPFVSLISGRRRAGQRLRGR